jgi:hypothetical protein
MDVSDKASYCIKEKLKIKAAKWGTPKKYKRTHNKLKIVLQIKHE